MKKSIFFIVMVAFASLQSVAQVTLKAPVHTKVLEVLSSGVNISIPATRVGANGPNWSKLTDTDIDKLMAMFNPNQFDLLVAGEVSNYYSSGAAGGETEAGPGVVTFRFDASKYQGMLSSY